MARLIVAISLLALALSVLVAVMLATLWSSNYITNNTIKKLKEYNKTNAGKKTINTTNYFEKQIKLSNQWIRLITILIFASLFLTSLVAIILLVVEMHECTRCCR